MEEGSRPTILIVDDEVANRALIRAYLGGTYDLLEATDGREALAMVGARPVDLVLLDVMMPGMTGLAVCRSVKQSAGGRYLPVILLTALGDQGDRNTGLEAGADDFLTKPVDRHELGLRVQTFIRLRRQDQLIHHQLVQLQQLDSLKDELVSLMVHDLRNPLFGIVGFLDSLDRHVGSDELREDVQMAMQASTQLRETLEDMLQIRMLESGAVRLHRELIEAGSLVRDAIASVWGAARARQVEIAPIADLTDLRMTADRKLVRRAVENLLTNALKYSPVGSVVTTAVRQAGSNVEIEVADRGRGIPDAVKDQLFQKFGSVEMARGELRRGVGLGLYLVKLVAVAHGGQARVKDREGGGTTFELILPRLEARTDPPPARPASG